METTTDSLKWKRRCSKLKKNIETVIPQEDNIKDPGIGIEVIDDIMKRDELLKSQEKKVEEQGLGRSQRINGKNYFFAEINFFKELVNISIEIKEKETSKEEIESKIKSLSDRCIQTGLAFVPYSSSKRFCVVSINEPNIVQIGEKIHLSVEMELVPVPKHTTGQQTKDYINTLDKELIEITSKEEDSDDESNSNSIFGELKSDRERHLKKFSMFGYIKDWTIRSFVVKSNDLVLQEEFVLQLLTQFQRIFDEENIPLKLGIYKVIAITKTSGLVEIVPNSISLDKLKSTYPNWTTLTDFFAQEYTDNDKLTAARTNFIRSAAAYSLACYFLQIKNRNNGNILIDNQGYIIHIDFTFLLSRTVKFEKAPFKLTEDFINVMGGRESQGFMYFMSLFVEGFLAVRKQYEKILLIVEMTLSSNSYQGQILPCLEDESVVRNLRKKFKFGWTEGQIQEYVKSLIVEATDNWRTTVSDTYKMIEDTT